MINFSGKGRVKKLSTGGGMVIKTKSGCVSCIVDCRTCGWTYENQFNGLAIAKKHALKYGHKVSIQVVTAVYYYPDELAGPG